MVDSFADINIQAWVTVLQHDLLIKVLTSLLTDSLFHTKTHPKLGLGSFYCTHHYKTLSI